MSGGNQQAGRESGRQRNLQPGLQRNQQHGPQPGPRPGQPMPRRPKPSGPLVTMPVVTYFFTALSFLVGALFIVLGLYNLVALRGTLGWWALLIGIPIAFFSVRHFLAARTRAAQFQAQVRAWEDAKLRAREQTRADTAEALKDMKNL
ncbi:DUF308 domain-containing protein [Haematomicrobium sanguinis]|uniref:DUF308 domain-containing protein n=1 Tax=Haematomicrobium sanguinis TaxID=479106 RepID=UPI000479E46D|nr:DUF308 domain-containing protein [Haematomicrobium sanguinis]